MIKDEWLAWRHNPIAKEWERLLQKEIDEMTGVFYDPNSVEKTALAAANLHGFMEALELALNIEPIFEDNSDS